MADNKNKVIVYRDWKYTFDELSDEEAGILIKHFFSYINDENPVLEDRVLRASWIPIERTLKRDLKKWLDSKDTKSLGGRFGNLKRWHPDLYEKVNNKEISLEDAEEIALSRKTSDSDKNIADIAVKDNVNVSVNDNVNVNVSVNYSKEGGVGEFLEDWNSLRKEILKKPSNLNRLATTIISDFREKSEQYSKIEFQNALKGLFKQQDIPKTVMTTSPKHFLENFETYLSAFYDDEYNLYSNDVKGNKSKNETVPSGNR